MTQAESKASRDLAERLSRVEPGTPRYEVLETARKFKRSWVELGEKLTRVKQKKLWQEWGFESFDKYCQQELHIRPQTAAKLTASYMFLNEQDPALLKNDGVQKPLPDVKVVDFLRRLHEKRPLDEKSFSQIKQMAYQQEASPQQLRQEVRKFAPPPARTGPTFSQLVEQARRLADRLATAVGIPRAIVERALALVEDLRALASGREE